MLTDLPDSCTNDDVKTRKTSIYSSAPSSPLKVMPRPPVIDIAQNIAIVPSPLICVAHVNHFAQSLTMCAGILVPCSVSEMRASQHRIDLL